MKPSVFLSAIAVAALTAAPAISAQDTARVTSQQVAPGIHMLVNAGGGNSGAADF